MYMYLYKFFAIFFRSYKYYLFFVALFSFITLLIVFISEYFFAILPCKLCLYERVAYFIFLFSSALLLLLHKYYSKNYYNIIITFFIIISIGSLLLGLYHVGTEYGILLGPAQCSSNLTLTNMTNEDIINILENREAVSCNVSKFRFIFSFSEWNIAASTIFLIYHIIILRLFRKKILL